MKLKGLPTRIYNIVFHTHTVSGIVISFALYVIFFAGAITLFRDEFYQWENPKARRPIVTTADYDAIIAQLKIKKPDFIVNEDLTFMAASSDKPMISIFGHIKGKGKEPDHFHAFYYPQTNEFIFEEPSTIGETLYRLHFFDQVPFYIGRYISGFVALFFAFATLTGLLIHWRNIVSKFYGFSLKGSWKQIWTNAHTVFGLIGLPFQLMYAITGAFYILLILILLPAVMVFFGGDQTKIFNLVRPNEAITVSAKSPVSLHNQPITKVIADLEKQYPDYEIPFFYLKNYGREDALFNARITNPDAFTGDGIISVRLKDGRQILKVIPNENKTYVQSVVDAIGRVHFGTFGGILLRIVYFVLSLFTCFVIISGVLLWKEARNKKEYTDKQKKFHHRVTMWYLAICFGLFPATAILFAAELAIPSTLTDHNYFVNTTFFVSWLLLTIAGLFWKTEAKLTRNYLYIGGVLSILVPLVNGFQTGDWFWKTLINGQHSIAGTDISWLLTGILSLFLARWAWKTPQNEPILQKGKIQNSVA